MGGGIAMALRQRRHRRLLKDTTQEALDRGLATIRKNYENSVQEGPLPAGRHGPAHGADPSAARPTTASKNADLIIEAAFESMAVKKQIFAEIDKIAKPDCVLATNTSTLDIDEIAAATSRPQMVIGTPFLQPRARHAAGRNRARQSHRASA